MTTDRVQSRVVITGAPMLIDGANRLATFPPERARVPARALRRSDVTTGSGETVVAVSAGIATPSGKVDVTLERDGRTRTAQWGASTLIGIERPTLPGIAPSPFASV